MAFFSGEIIGGTLVFFVLFAIVLAIGKIKALRPHPLRVHLLGVIVVWLTAAVILGRLQAAAPVSAYLLTLAAIWSYRREVNQPPSGWYRIGAGLTAIWCVLGILLLNAFSPTDNGSSRVGCWLWAVVGLLPWLLGWLVQWIRQGFQRGETTHS